MTNTNSLFRKFPGGCNQPLQISQGPATHLEVSYPFALEETFDQSNVLMYKIGCIPIPYPYQLTQTNFKKVNKYQQFRYTNRGQKSTCLGQFCQKHICPWDKLWAVTPH